jgi:hypothetical protein
VGVFVVVGSAGKALAARRKACSAELIQIHVRHGSESKRFMTHPYAPPAETGRKDISNRGLDEHAPALVRVLALQLALMTVLSIVVGTLMSAQFGFGLAKFGGLEYVPRIVVLSGVRLTGAGASAAASLFALLVATHRASSASVRPMLRRLASASLGLAVAGTPAAVLVVVGSGFLLTHFSYGLAWQLLADSTSVITRDDLLAATYNLLRNLAVVAGLAWFAWPQMAERSWSLARRVIATLLASALVHGGIDLALSWVG